MLSKCLNINQLFSLLFPQFDSLNFLLFQPFISPIPSLIHHHKWWCQGSFLFKEWRIFREWGQEIHLTQLCKMKWKNGLCFDFSSEHKSYFPTHSFSFKGQNNALLSLITIKLCFFSLWHQPSNLHLSPAYLANPQFGDLWHSVLYCFTSFGIWFAHVTERSMFCYTHDIGSIDTGCQIFTLKPLNNFL